MPSTSHRRTAELPKLRIPNLFKPPADVSDFDGGLGERHIEHDLEVLLKRPVGALPGTFIRLYWNSATQPSAYMIVEDKHQHLEYLTLRVPADHIRPEWANPVYCTIKPPLAAEMSTHPLKIRVKLTRPGDKDPNDQQDGHQGFSFALPADVEVNGVDDERAREGIKVVIQPYSHMTEFDTCFIAWGSQLVTHVVQAHEVGNAFTMTIAYHTLLLAGDNDFMPVAMQVMDVVGNFPDPYAPWSAKKAVRVGLDLPLLEAPFLENRIVIIYLDELGDDDQVVQFYAGTDDFERYDVVTLVWDGVDSEGFLVPHTDEVVINQVGRIYNLSVGNPIVKAIAGGKATISYSLYHPASKTTRYSRKLSIQVIGDGVEWPAPIVLEAVRAYLDPTSPQATVVFYTQPGWDPSHLLQLFWVATTHSYFDERLVGEIPIDKKMTFIVGGEDIKPFDGLHTELYYQLVDDTGQRVGTRQSLRLPLRVGEPVRDMPAVRVEKTFGTHLDPDDVPIEARVTMPFTDTFIGDLITLYWVGPRAETSIEVDVFKETAGRELPIPVLATYIAPNVGYSVDVFYTLDRQNQPTRYSAILTLQIRRGQEDHTTFDLGDLNGWIPGSALSDPRDIAFPQENGNTYFQNYTYPSQTKAGVIFSKRFSGLKPGRQYEFSLSARRFDGRFALPVLSLSTTLGPLVGPVSLTSLTSWQSLKGTVTVNATELQLYINSHEASSEGNDYQLDDIVFRLLPASKRISKPARGRKAPSVYAPSLGHLHLPEMYPGVSSDPDTDGSLGLSSVENPLICYVAVPPSARPGQLLELFCNDQLLPVAHNFVLPGDLERGVIPLTLAARHITAGRMDPLICRINQTQEATLPLRLEADLNPPAGHDSDPEKPGHQRLILELPADVLIQGVDELRARHHVRLLLHPYPHMARNDEVRVQWGDQHLRHRVRQDEVGQKVELVVPYHTIMSARDSLALHVVVQVRGHTGNYQIPSARWSASTSVNVHVRNDELVAPALVDGGPQADVIDLLALEGKPLGVFVYADRDSFEVNDRLHLHWHGVDGQGTPLHYSQTLTLVKVGLVIYFHIPYELLLDQTQGLATLYYELEKHWDSSRQHSLRQCVRVEGPLDQWPAPLVNTAGPDGHLGLVQQGITVKVPYRWSWRPSDLVSLVWLLPAPHDTVEYRRSISAGERPESGFLTFNVPAVEVNRFQGRDSYLYYQADSGVGVDQRTGQSRRLKLLVGDVSIPMQAPTVLKASNHRLDLRHVLDGAWVTIPSTTSRPVMLHWIGPLKSIVMPAVPAAPGESAKVKVPATYVSANVNHVVKVYWSEAGSGEPLRYSDVYTVEIVHLQPR